MSRLSVGSAFSRFWNSRVCVLKYLEEKNEDWLWDLAFVADIMGYLNNLR